MVRQVPPVFTWFGNRESVDSLCLARTCAASKKPYNFTTNAKSLFKRPRLYDQQDSCSCPKLKLRGRQLNAKVPFFSSFVRTILDLNSRCSESEPAGASCSAVESSINYVEGESSQNPTMLPHRSPLRHQSYFVDGASYQIGAASDAEDNLHCFTNQKPDNNKFEHCIHMV